MLDGQHWGEPPVIIGSNRLARAVPFAVIALLGSQPLSAGPPPSSDKAPPLARVEMVVDSTFGIRVEDPYRWMEAPGNAELLDWIRAHAASTRRRLDAIPERPA